MGGLRGGDCMARQHGFLAAPSKLRPRRAAWRATQRAPPRTEESNHSKVGLPHSLASPSAARRPPLWRRSVAHEPGQHLISASALRLATVA
eukprot:6741320-Prymnesium_polylepis.1